MAKLLPSLHLVTVLVAVVAPATAFSAPAEAEPAPATAPATLTFESVVAAPPAAVPVPPATQGPVPVAGRTAAIVARERRDACAVDEPTRSGFYLRLMSGLADARFHGTGPHGSVSASGSGAHSTIAIGGGIAQGLALAGTIQSTSTESTFEGGPFSKATLTTDSATTNASAKARLTQAQLGVLVDWYPHPQSGFHGGASAGFGAISLINNADDSKLGGPAMSGSLFIGYDTAIARSWALGLTLAASGVTSTSLKNSDGEETGYKLSAFSIQLGASLLFF